MLQLRRQSVLNAKLSLYLAGQYSKFYKRTLDYKKLAWRQSKTIRRLLNKQREQDAAIADLKRRIEECDIKYSELTHTNQAAGGKAMPPGVGASDAVGVPGSGGGVGAGLRHFGSQIKLDLSVLPIGTGKRSQGKLLPNIKPRKPLIKLPSLSDEPPAKQMKMDDAPSTSQSPRSKSLSTIAKIRGITNEIRHLTNLTNFEGKLKRTLSLTSLDLIESECKKQKLD